jgi:hypothetical protein
MIKKTALAICMIISCMLIHANGSGNSNKKNAAKNPDATATIDPATLDAWAAPYRGWHYYGYPVIEAELKIPMISKPQGS